MSFTIITSLFFSHTNIYISLGFLLEMQVKELMKRVYTIDKNIYLKEAAKIMSDKGYSCLIFISGNKMKGIITERDMLKNFGANRKISEVMTKKVITINENEDISKAMDVMKEKNIKKLPVVDSKNNLVGIITLTDIAKHSDELEEGFFFN